MSWPSTTAASPSSASSFADHPFTPVSDKESVEDAFDRQDDVEFEDLGQDSTLLRYEDTGDAIAGAERNDLGDEDDRNHALLAGRRKRRRRSSVQSYELYTPEEERAVARKLDTKLALYVAFLYLLSFLDRGNLGNAEIAGLSTDLNLTNNQFQWLIKAFYITYIAFEFLTLSYKYFRPHRFISCCVLAWGLLASLQSLVSSFGALLTLRIFLGVSEAAFTGIPIYLSFFYRREELAFRTGMFIAAAPLATSFASFLAWIIVKFGDSVPIANWRLIFLIEGFPACIAAIFTYHWLPDSPAQARWLDTRDREVAELRKRKEASINQRRVTGKLPDRAGPRSKSGFRWGLAVQTLRDPTFYVRAGIAAVMFFCVNIGFGSLPVFLPVILKDGGYSQAKAEGLSAIPNVTAFCAVLVTAWISDRRQDRSIPITILGLLAMGGYLLLAIGGAHLGHTLRYLAFFPISIGLFSCVTLIVTWIVNNQPSDEAKTLGMAIMQYFGQIGPMVGASAFPEEDAPYFKAGMYKGAIAMGMVALLAFTLRLFLLRENRRRQGKTETSSLSASGDTMAEIFIYIT